MSLEPKDMSDILKMFKTSRRVKGTTVFVVTSLAVLFSYQNCVNQKTIETQVKEAVTAPPTNVEVDVALISDCPNGGLSLVTYLDANINGKLDEEETIKSTQNVCNGSDGTNGTNGMNGTNGVDGVGAGIAVTQASTAECSAGGIKVTTFSDKNNNGVLDLSESITSVSSVCNGSNGANGTDGITSQITATKATTAQCSNGGVVYTISSDIDMPVSTVVCNGVDGTNGSNGANGSNASVSQSVASASQCPTGGTVIETKTDNSEPVYSVICNGAKGDTGATGAAGSSAYITTSVASPYQCSNGGVVISTWTDTSNPTTQVVCNGTNGVNGTNGTNGSSSYVSTTQATASQCASGGVIITTTGTNQATTQNIICNGVKGANGAIGATGATGVSYLTGYVGPLVSGKNYSACHHDYIFFPATGSSSSGWLVFRHQKNGTEDQGVGNTGFNIWNADIANFVLESETKSTTYCSMTYDPKGLTMSYSVVDKSDGLQGKSGTINLK